MVELDVQIAGFLEIAHLAFEKVFGPLEKDDGVLLAAQQGIISRLATTMYIQNTRGMFSSPKKEDIETATVKQKALMDQLKISYTSTTTKQEASKLIEEKLKA